MLDAGEGMKPGSDGDQTGGSISLIDSTRLSLTLTVDHTLTEIQPQQLAATFGSHSLHQPLPLTTDDGRLKQAGSPPPVLVHN
jgi:hypothetical protein